MRNYKQCSKCVLDTNDDPEIHFNTQGICNFCLGYKQKYVSEWPTEEELAQKLAVEISEIKLQGKNKPYDCIMGLSGGVDSSFLALKAMEWGLRPLLVHFDNGWNSELAVQNINGIVEKTGFDLYTYVVDWEEYMDLQLSYIKSGVIDWEVPTDHGFFAVLYKQASKRGIKSVLTGSNYQTESILPKSMSWRKQDLANILDIHNKFGTRKLKTFPQLGFYKYLLYQKIRNFKVYGPLDYIDYNKDLAKTEIIEKFGWKDYGGKHYESIFTRFYQGYVLPKKFNVDKRKAHFSSLINSGQMSRLEALVEINKPTYTSSKQLEEDLSFFLKKMNLSKKEFEEILVQKPVKHTQFKSYTTGLYLKHESFFKKINSFRRKN